MRVVDNVGFDVKKQDIPGGGSGGGSGQPLATPDWNQNDETAADYIKNRPFYTTDPVETELVNGTFAFVADHGLYMNQDITIVLVEGNTYKVSIDGVEYETVCQNYHGSLYIGSIEILTWGTPEYPFAYMPAVGPFATNISGDSHDIVIKSSVSTTIPIPDKYIPKSVKATELSIGNSGLVFSDTGKVVTFSDIDTLRNHEVIIKVLTSSGSQYHKCLCIEIDESNKFAYLMFTNLNSSSSDFSNVSIRRYKIDENGTALD